MLFKHCICICALDRVPLVPIIVHEVKENKENYLQRQHVEHWNNQLQPAVTSLLHIALPVECLGEDGRTSKHLAEECGEQIARPHNELVADVVDAHLDPIRHQFK